jgi:hypothetical protein
MLKKYKMNNCKPVSTPIECEIKLSKHEERETMDSTIFRNLVGSLRYLTCTRLDIIYGTGLVSRYMESPTTTHFKAAKSVTTRLLQKGISENFNFTRDVTMSSKL